MAGHHKKPWAVLDAESDPFAYERFVKPFLWGFYCGESGLYRTFDTVLETVTFLKENAYLVYAHNGGKFDYHFMLDHVPSAAPLYNDGLIDGFDLTGACPKIISGRLAEFMIGASTFRDSYNILPVALGSYVKDTIDYSIFEEGERDKPKNAAEIRKYLRSDCLYLYEIVKNFRDKYGDGLTLAGSAMREWVKMEQEKMPRGRSIFTGVAGVQAKFSAPESTKKFYDDIAPYYMGGRVECFQGGLITDDFNVYDINSAYPFAMLAQHPISVGFNVSRPDHRCERVRTSSMYRVRAISDGAFPLRKPNGTLWFPTKVHGPQDFFVTGWEYLAGIETKTVQIINIIERLDFCKTTNFKTYVDHFYEKRMGSKKLMKCLEAQGKEGSDEWREAKANEIVFKTMLNGLYGKFAACPRSYKQYTIVNADHYRKFLKWRHGVLIRAWQKRREKRPDATGDPCPETSDYTFAGEWMDGTGERVLMMAPSTTQRYYNVATAASITGFVRAHVWRTICSLKAKGCVPLYCDTDSISVQGEVGNSIALSEKLGDWKHEALCDHGAICGKKMYAFHIKNPTPKMIAEGKTYKQANKGVKITAEEIYKIAKGETITYKPIAPTAGLKGVNMDFFKVREAKEQSEQPISLAYVKGKKVRKSPSKRASKKQPKKVRLRKGSFVFTDRHVKMTL